MSTEQKYKGLDILVELPKGVAADFRGGFLTISGPLGSCRKDLSKIRTRLEVRGDGIHVTSYSGRRRDLAITNTARSIVSNMIEGVTKGFTCRLKMVFAHFPLSVKVKGSEVCIENFYGERSPRLAKILGDCKVVVEGDDLIVTGVSLEDVGQTAANIEQATSVRRRDQRVFLDGLYVYEKKRGMAIS